MITRKDYALISSTLRLMADRVDECAAVGEIDRDVAGARLVQYLATLGVLCAISAQDIALELLEDRALAIVGQGVNEPTPETQPGS